MSERARTGRANDRLRTIDSGDLAGFARKIATNGAEVANAVLAECRARAGEHCPVDGMWESIGVPTERVHYKHGAALRDLDSSYGLTVWRLIRD